MASSAARAPALAAQPLAAAGHCRCELATTTSLATHYSSLRSRSSPRRQSTSPCSSTARSDAKKTFNCTS
ncbi:hypothetical protein EJB05_49397 [Eragrostis curvula]|uniref:Uncharacterized protein n=1 Tax=Eragrostis curvula TaxID=38414 RepID=A0A5J9T4P0_9POAL|nr:hypothetical protein EJB05_49397 [Eragrostis curvula]